MITTGEGDTKDEFSVVYAPARAYLNLPTIASTGDISLLGLLRLEMILKMV